MATVRSLSLCWQVLVRWIKAIILLWLPSLKHLWTIMKEEIKRIKHIRWGFFQLLDKGGVKLDRMKMSLVFCAISVKWHEMLLSTNDAIQLWERGKGTNRVKKNTEYRRVPREALSIHPACAVWSATLFDQNHGTPSTAPASLNVRAGVLCSHGKLWFQTEETRFNVRGALLY